MIRDDEEGAGLIQSLELLLDDETDAAVRAQWAALIEAGLPSQARHEGESNAPHITLCASTQVPPYVETALKAALTGRLPVEVRLAGVLCLPGRPGTQVLARAVVPSVELLQLQATCARYFEGLPGLSRHTMPGEWSPHVTLANPIPTEQVGSALSVLAADGRRSVGAAVAVRRWDAQARTTWRVA